MIANACCDMKMIVCEKYVSKSNVSHYFSHHNVKLKFIFQTFSSILLLHYQHSSFTDNTYNNHNGVNYDFRYNGSIYRIMTPYMKDINDAMSGCSYLMDEGAVLAIIDSQEELAVISSEVLLKSHSMPTIVMIRHLI